MTASAYRRPSNIWICSHRNITDCISYYKPILPDCTSYYEPILPDCTITLVRWTIYLYHM